MLELAYIQVVSCAGCSRKGQVKKQLENLKRWSNRPESFAREISTVKSERGSRIGPP